MERVKVMVLRYERTIEFHYVWSVSYSVQSGSRCRRMQIILCLQSPLEKRGWRFLCSTSYVDTYNIYYMAYILRLKAWENCAYLIKTKLKSLVLDAKFIGLDV